MSRLATLIFCALLIALPALAGDPWLKPHAQWTQKEINKILRESPWAQSSSAVPKWTKRVDLVRVGPNDPGIARGEPHYPQDSAASDAGQSMPGGPTSTPPRDLVAAFYIRWSSSRTVRAALLQQDVLRGRLSQSEADQRLANSPDDYSIEITDEPVIGFPEMNEHQLASKAYIELSGSGRRIAPSRVVIQTASDGRTTGVVYFFSREVPGSTSPLLESPRVRFNCEIDNVGITADFHPYLMRDGAGPDL